jgi:hypothetical protein
MAPTWRRWSPARVTVQAIWTQDKVVVPWKADRLWPGYRVGSKGTGVQQIVRRGNHGSGRVRRAAFALPTGQLSDHIGELAVTEAFGFCSRPAPLNTALGIPIARCSCTTELSKGASSRSLNGSVEATTRTLFLGPEPQSSTVSPASIPWAVLAQAPRQFASGLNACCDCFRICGSKCIQSRYPVAPGIPPSSLSGPIVPLPPMERLRELGGACDSDALGQDCEHPRLPRYTGY